MKHFCTYFDSNYAVRGLSLFRSMEKHCGDFCLHVLCCDDEAFALVGSLQIDNLRALRLAEVEAFEPRLAGVKAERSRVEYLWTLSPIWPLFLLERCDDIDLICYLDADLFFFSSDEPLWQEFGQSSVLIIEHRFPAATKHLANNGRFNVGLVAYRRDANGLKCLDWYRDRCLEWCYDRNEDGRYGDQKYLDEFPLLFEGVHVLQHPGANVAPWNWMNGPLHQGKDGVWLVGKEPLVFFHFHGLKILNSWLFDASMHDHNYGEMPLSLLAQLYRPYLAALSATARWVRARGFSIRWGHTVIENYGRRMLLSKLRRRRLILFWGMR